MKLDGKIVLLAFAALFAFGAQRHLFAPGRSTEKVAAPPAAKVEAAPAVAPACEPEIVERYIAQCVAQPHDGGYHVDVTPLVIACDAECAHRNLTMEVTRSDAGAYTLNCDCAQVKK